MFVSLLFLWVLSILYHSLHFTSILWFFVSAITRRLTIHLIFSWTGHVSKNRFVEFLSKFIGKFTTFKETRRRAKQLRQRMIQDKSWLISQRMVSQAIRIGIAVRLRSEQTLRGWWWRRLRWLRWWRGGARGCQCEFIVMTASIIVLMVDRQRLKHRAEIHPTIFFTVAIQINSITILIITITIGFGRRGWHVEQDDDSSGSQSAGADEEAESAIEREKNDAWSGYHHQTNHQSTSRDTKNSSSDNQFYWYGLHMHHSASKQRDEKTYQTERRREHQLL